MRHCKMRRRARHVVRAATLGAVIALLAAAGCRRADSEQALRTNVAGLRQAIERRDAGAIGDHLSADFIGTGGLDRDGARRMAALYFMRKRSIGVTLGPLDVTMQGDRARVDCTAALTGGSGAWLPDSGRIYDVRSGWRLENGQWRLTSLEWTPR